jgi:hypothetical protein
LQGALVGPEEGASVGPEEAASVCPDEGTSVSASDPWHVGPKDGIKESLVDSEGKTERDAVGQTISAPGGKKDDIKEGKAETLGADDAAGLNEMVRSRAEPKWRHPKMEDC